MTVFMNIVNGIDFHKEAFLKIKRILKKIAKLDLVTN